MPTSFSTTLLNPDIGSRGSPSGGFGSVLGFAPEVQPNNPEWRDAYNAVTPRVPLDALMRSLDQGYTYSVWGSAYGGYSRVTGRSDIG